MKSKYRTHQLDIAALDELPGVTHLVSLHKQKDLPSSDQSAKSVLLSICTIVACVLIRRGRTGNAERTKSIIKLLNVMAMNQSCVTRHRFVLSLGVTSPLLQSMRKHTKLKCVTTLNV
jgi:hypothetical protein